MVVTRTFEEKTAIFGHYVVKIEKIVISHNAALVLHSPIINFNKTGQMVEKLK
jgi:hypothetical protein